MSFVTEGLEGLGGLADKWLEYQVVKGQIDVETRTDDRNISDRVDAYSPASSSSSSANGPPWILMGAIGLAALVLIVFVVRR